jgi:hypothetical protein
MTLPVIALLGRKDQPTDAVEEYCRYLGGALVFHEFEVQIRRVPWELRGWREALRALKLQATDWRGKWVIVQYTALAWSARGFPLRFLRALKILKTAGARIGVVFHDVEPFSGSRSIDRLRRRVQVYVMRRALAMSDAAIFTVAPDKISWLKAAPTQAAFIPVGSNLPFLDEPPPKPLPVPPVVGVFSITGGEQGAIETRAIVQAMRHAARQIGPLRLSVFGRHAELRESDLRSGLREVPVQLSVEGVLDPAQVVNRLAECDVLLFVRKGISTRRSSAIAGIAAGLPIVAYRDPETAAPITEAGVLLVDSAKPEQLSDALVRILTDAALREGLTARSRSAYHAHFAWKAIARDYSALLRSK